MLWYLKDMDSDEVYEIHDGMIIGRTEGSLIFPKSELLSRKHCKIEVSEEGVFIIDLNSRNGTLVSGQRCAPLAKTQLAEECTISIGDKKFLFKKKVVLSTTLIRYQAKKRGA